MITNLESVVLPPPLPAVLAILLVAGLVFLGRRLASLLLPRQVPSLLDTAGAFIVTAGLAGAAVHGLALAQLAHLVVLRVMGWSLALAGAFEIWRGARRYVPKALSEIREKLRDASPAARGAILLTCGTLIGLCLTALGPATDSDSLNYHLGVPLAWLHRHGAFPTPEWLHSRLVGLGEALNMLGLAAGTDCLGAAVQVASLVVLCVALSRLGRTLEDRTLASLLVVSCPTMLFLVPNQKPQLLGVAATTVALLMAIRWRESRDDGRMALALGCVATAVGQKLTFFLSGTVVVLLALHFAWRARKLGRTALTGVIAYCALVLPLHLRNLAFYGDPISPVLERFRAAPDPLVVAFGHELRARAGEPTLARLLRLPLDLVVTADPGLISSVLGVGALAVLAITAGSSTARWLLAAAGLSAAATIGLSQLSPRFFLEPYMWAGAAAVLAEWTWRKRLLFALLIVQCAAMANLAAAGVVMSFPGALSSTLREQVMTRMASGYAEAKWLDSVLPGDAVILGASRSNALWPRPFVPADRVWWAWGDAGWPRLIESFVTENNVTAIVLRGEQAQDAIVDHFVSEHEFTLRRAGFSRATRNPYNRGQRYELTLLLR